MKFTAMTTKENITSKDLNNAPSQLMEIFKSQLLLTVQDDPSMTNPNDLMITAGLSKKTIDRLMTELNFDYEGDRIIITEQGILNLEAQVQNMDGLDRFEHILGYYKMLPPPMYFKLIGLNFSQFTSIAALISETSGVKKKRACLKAYSYIAEQMPDSAMAKNLHSDEIVEQITKLILKN